MNILLSITFYIRFGCSKERPIGVVLLRAHNICFGWWKRKLIFDYSLAWIGLFYIRTKSLKKIKINKSFKVMRNRIPGRVVQSVMCLATDASLTADSGVPSSIPARSHTLVEIDHEINSMVILPSAESFKKGCCRLRGKEYARSTG